MIGGSSRNVQVVVASPEAAYNAFVDPEQLIVWLPPGDMTGQFHRFDAVEGGGYEMSLFYPASEQRFQGKTGENEDRVQVRFVELDGPRKIVQVATFDSPDPAFAGEMTMTITFEPTEVGTQVTLLCENIPPGIRPEDNEEGCRSSLEKLAQYLRTKQV